MTATPSKKFPPSPQMQLVYDAVRNGRGNILVSSLAGTGKTTTIFGSIDINYEMARGRRIFVAYAAFNVKIRKEAQGKAQERGDKDTTIKTANGFGHGAWYKALTDVGKKSDPDPGKSLKLCDQLKVPKEFHSFVPKLVGQAKQRAFGIATNENSLPNWVDIIDRFNLMDELIEPEEYTGDFNREELMYDGIKYAHAVLQKSREVARDHYDYDDQIYMPLYHKLKFFQFNWLYVDEAQDTNLLRRILYRNLIYPGGRAMFVGDKNQAIYGFTGADSDSLEIIKNEFQCEEYKLSVCWRCAEEIVKDAQEEVPELEAAPNAPKGGTYFLWQRDFNAGVKGDKDYLCCSHCYSVVPVADAIHADEKLCPECRGTLDDRFELRRDDIILCRNTAPLVEQAFALIRAGVACHVEGKEIGQGLAKLAGKWPKIKALDKLREKLQKYLDERSAKLIEQDKAPQAEALADKVLTLFVIMESLPPGSDVEALTKRIGTMFSDTEDGKPAANLSLMTVHKSKGLEGSRVIILGRNKFMPSKWARKDWELEQEKNLLYVAKTRAMRELIYVDME